MTDEDQPAKEAASGGHLSLVAPLGIALFSVGAYSTGAALVRVSAALHLGILIPMVILTVGVALFSARATGNPPEKIRNAGLVFGGYGIVACGAALVIYLVKS